MSVIISDTSCLILLTKINKLSLLKELFGQIYITEIIADEYGEALPDYIIIKENHKNEILKIFQSNLGLGELSAIALALEMENPLLILDDKKAKLFATKLGLQSTGVLGILLVAKQEGKISSIKSELLCLKEQGMWLSEKMIQEVLREANETE